MRTRPIATAMAGLVLIAVIAITVGAGHTGQLRLDTCLDSKVRIINFDKSVARFDTSTGSIHELNGDLKNPSVRCTWTPHVKGVNKKTSGYLEIQHAGGGTFLVDRVTGDSWVLRRRGSNAKWDEVKLFR